jgi:uncharacterized OsmC-like protein
MIPVIYQDKVIDIEASGGKKEEKLRKLLALAIEIQIDCKISKEQASKFVGIRYDLNGETRYI